MRYTDIAWDFDGTLFNSYPFMLNCFKKSLACFGFEDTDEHIMRHLVVMVKHAAQYYQDRAGIPAEHIMEKYRYYDHIPDFEQVKPFEGVAGILAYVVQSGRKNHLFTHRNQTALQYLEHHGLNRYFTECITSEQGFPIKPDPTALLYLMEKQHIEPNRLLMVGDRKIDLDCVKNAGGDACFFNSNHLPVPSTADYTITAFTELKGII